MVAAEVQYLGNLVEGAIETHLCDQRALGMVVGPVQRSAAQDIHPHDPIDVIATLDEQHVPEALWGAWRVRGEPILDSVDDVSLGVDERLPSMAQHNLWIRVERLDAAQQ
jgi:hypothetical protein